MEQTQHRDINREQRKQTVVFALLGGMFIAMILLLTTIWVTNSARTGTKLAVDQVSEFYLEELAWRRAQVVSEELKNSFLSMETALDILEEENLESQEALRLYRAQHDFRIKPLQLSFGGTDRTRYSYV